LQVEWKKGDEHEADISCDSKFMAKCMGKIGEAMREKHHWVPLETTVRARVKGKTQCGSLETNIIDLGLG